MDRNLILVVDDEPGIRGLVREYLEESGYRVLDAHSGDGALALLHRYRGQISLVLTDWEMLGMRGLDVANSLHEIEPGLPIIYMSGHYNSIAMQGVMAGQGTVIRKPFKEADLLSAVKGVLDGLQASG